MKIVQQDVDKLHKTAGDSLEKLLGASSNNNAQGKTGVSKKTEDAKELKRYQDALSYLSQSARIPESTQSMETAMSKLPKIAFAEKIRAEYQEKTSNDLDFLVPECPQLRILVIGKVEAGKSTLCARLLGLSDEAVSRRCSFMLLSMISDF
jgi:ATPase subunit of ABC transporter with duplicated ATPase domains